VPDQIASTAATGTLPPFEVTLTMRLEVEFALSMTDGSSMLAMIPTCPAHLSQVSMSILNTRLSRCIQVIDAWRSAGVLSSQLSPAKPANAAANSLHGALPPCFDLGSIEDRSIGQLRAGITGSHARHGLGGPDEPIHGGSDAASMRQTVWNGYRRYRLLHMSQFLIQRINRSWRRKSSK
jgi:hypothetical protein